jgi:hypothetical protein
MAALIKRGAVGIQELAQEIDPRLSAQRLVFRFGREGLSK